MMSLSYPRIVVAAIVATFSLGGQIAWGGAVCKTVNGLYWCYNPDQCGQACDGVCAAANSVPIPDDAKWFAAQNSVEKCQAIATAFGLATIDFGSYEYACVEDSGGEHSSPGGFVEPLVCSSYSECPAFHRTGMDEIGVACGSDSRRSICPCAPLPAPTLGTMGMVVCGGMMLLYGVKKLSSRRV
jgi:hypothetical protein